MEGGYGSKIEDHREASDVVNLGNKTSGRFCCVLRPQRSSSVAIG